MPRSQDVRMEKRARLLSDIDEMETNIRTALEDPASDPEVTIDLLNDFSDAVAEMKNHPDELKWDMLNAQAFITSVQTSTGQQGILV